MSAGPAYESYLSKTTREAGFTFFGQVFALGFGFVANAVIARLLGADLLGVYVLAWTVVMAASVLTTFGFEGGFVRYISMYAAQGREGEARSVYSLGMRFGLVAGLVGTAAVVVLRRPIGGVFFHDSRLASALLVMAFAIAPYTLARLQSSALRALKDMRRSIVGLELWLRIPRLVIFLGLFLLGYRLGGILVGTVVACAASALATGRFVSRSEPALVRGPSAPVPRREFVSYSSLMFAETATAFALLQSGRVVLGVFLTTADVGVFNVVALLAGLATLFTFSFNAIFSPIIADVYHRGDLEMMKSLLLTVTRWIVLLTLPVFVWLVVSGEAILSIFGGEFVRGYAALAALAGAQLFDSTAGSVSSCLAMTRYQRFNVYNILAMAVVSVVLNLVLVPRMGILGAAVATGIAIVLVNVARLFEGRMLLGLLPFNRSSARIAVIAAVLFVASYVVRTIAPVPREWYWSVATLAAAYAVTLALAAVLGFSDEDRVIWSAIGRKLLGRKPRA
jgi:O-antigen/teichoic acid export membrane protein